MGGVTSTNTVTMLKGIHFSSAGERMWRSVIGRFLTSLTHLSIRTGWKKKLIDQSIDWRINRLINEPINRPQPIKNSGAPSHYLPSPRTLHWKRAASPSRAEALATGEMTTGGATAAAESGEADSGTATQSTPPSAHALKHFTCSWSTPRLTFHVERRCAGRGAVVVLGLAVVDGGVLGEHLDQQQRVLVAVVEELALEARGQSLRVFVPGHLRRRDAAHLHREASRFPRHHRLGLHVAKDLRRLRD